MGAHHAALVLETPTLPGTSDRLCRLAMVGSQYYYSGASLRCGADSLRVSGERKRVVAPIRSDATPSKGGEDEPNYRLFRQPASSTSSFHQQQLRSIAKSPTAKTEGTWGMDEATTDEEVDDHSEQYESDSMYCDLLPHSLVCQFLQLASIICDGVDSELKLEKSKKPKRLSTTSSDLFD